MSSHVKYQNRTIRSIFLRTRREDLALLRYFRKRSKGFYVDVGAHHPLRFSNTWAFYQQGWNGINIDPLPGTLAAFSELRPRDITLEIGISDEPGELTYHLFNEPAYNTFSYAAAQLARDKGARTIGTMTVPVKTLTSILDQHVPAGKHIDLMTIDVEGFDEAVTRSLDFSRYRPEVLVVEIMDADLEEVIASKLYKLLRDQGYRVYAKTGNSLILIDKFLVHDREN